MRYLSKTLALALCTICSVSTVAQVINFSMEAEKTNKNTPEEWNEVQLPKDLPTFTEANTFYITSYGAAGWW